jgi:type I restriction enzyme R subunit
MSEPELGIVYVLTNPAMPGLVKIVQARILEYAEAIGWTVVSREEPEHRRGFDPDVPPADRAKNRSLFFDDLLDAKVQEFNPRYAEAEGASLGQFRHLHTDIYENRNFVDRLSNRGKFFDHEEKREGDHYQAPSRPLRHEPCDRQDIPSGARLATFIP